MADSAEGSTNIFESLFGSVSDAVTSIFGISKEKQNESYLLRLQQMQEYYARMYDEEEALEEIEGGSEEISTTQEEAEKEADLAIEDSENSNVYEISGENVTVNIYTDKDQAAEISEQAENTAENVVEQSSDALSNDTAGIKVAGFTSEEMQKYGLDNLSNEELNSVEISEDTYTYIRDDTGQQDWHSAEGIGEVAENAENRIDAIKSMSDEERGRLSIDSLSDKEIESIHNINSSSFSYISDDGKSKAGLSPGIETAIKDKMYKGFEKTENDSVDLAGAKTSTDKGTDAITLTASKNAEKTASVGEKTLGNTAEKVTEKAGRSAGNTAGDAAKGAAKEAGKEIGKEAGKEVGKEAGKTAAKTIGGVALGVATGGASLAFSGTTTAMKMGTMAANKGINSAKNASKEQQHKMQRASESAAAVH